MLRSTTFSATFATQRLFDSCCCSLHSYAELFVHMMEPDQLTEQSGEALTWLQKIYEHGVSANWSLTCSISLALLCCAWACLLDPLASLLLLAPGPSTQHVADLVWTCTQKSIHNESLFGYFRGQTKQDDLTVSGHTSAQGSSDSNYCAPQQHNMQLL